MAIPKDRNRENEMLRKHLLSAMIYADVDYEHIGNATGRAWRDRLKDPGNMKVRDLMYLADRLGFEIKFTVG